MHFGSRQIPGWVANVQEGGSGLCMACRFTGADLSALVREGALKALERDIDAGTVSHEDFAKAVQIVKPSPPVTHAQAQMYAAFKQGSH